MEDRDGVGKMGIGVARGDVGRVGGVGRAVIGKRVRGAGVAGRV